MTLYQIDENVLREAHSGGHKNVQKWLRSVDDSNLRISVITLAEKHKGVEVLRKSDPIAADKRLTMVTAFEKGFEGRIVSMTPAEAAEWGRAIGQKDKNRFDLALAATARVNGMTLVTRNIKDVEGRGARLLDPFKNPPETIEAGPPLKKTRKNKSVD